MGATTGVQVIGDYAGAANDSAAVDVLLALIPDPDAAHGTGAAANAAGNPVGASYLDEMSPGAAAQLRVELTALQAAVATTNTL